MNDPSVAAYTWIGLVIVLIIYGYLGYLGNRRTKSLSDFTIGGAQLGPYLLGIAYAATFFSAATFVGYVAWAYAWGYSALWIFLAIFVASTLGLITFARRAREVNIKQKSQSLPDWLGDYYNSDFIRVGMGVFLLFNLFYIAGQLLAGAYVFYVLLGWPYHAALAFITVIIVAYVVAGGTFADVYTDAVQGILMALMGLAIFGTGLYNLGRGGLANLTQTMHNTDPALTAVFNPASDHFYAASAVVGVFIIEYVFSAGPQLFNKVLALKKPADLRKMILTFYIFAFCMMLVIFAGFFAHQFNVQTDVADHVIYNYVGVMFPPIVSALLVMVILSAALSTSDGVLIVLGTYFSNDLFRKFLVKRGFVKVSSDEELDRKALKIGRISTVVIGLSAAALVIEPPAFLATFMWFAAVGLAGIVGPLLVGLFMKEKVTSLGAILAMILGVASSLIFVLGGIERSAMAAAAWGSLVSVAFMIVYTLIFPRRSVEEADRIAG